MNRTEAKEQGIIYLQPNTKGDYMCSLLNTKGPDACFSCPCDDCYCTARAQTCETKYNSSIIKELIGE